jgi:hypothetical protein
MPGRAFSWSSEALLMSRGSFFVAVALSDLVAGRLLGLRHHRTYGRDGERESD